MQATDGLSKAEMQLRNRIVELSSRHLKLENEIVFALQEVEACKLHRKLGYSSLFKYLCAELCFSEPVAYSFITVARASLKIPQLKTALNEGKISVSRASRIVSALDSENAESLIEFAAKHSARETDFEVARRNPKSRKDRIKILSEDRVELSVSVSKEAYETLKRIQDLMSADGSVSIGEVLEKIGKAHLERIDPVLKARRVRSRKLCSNRVPTKADARHVVHDRDGGRCTYIERNGNRCNNERWLHIHHIQPRSRGGKDSPENLTTLCAAHHDLVHQMEMPGLLRSKRVEYRVS